jgi:hypothetical protein
VNCLQSLVSVTSSLDLGREELNLLIETPFPRKYANSIPSFSWVCLIDDLFFGKFPGSGSACNHAVAWLT